DEDLSWWDGDRGVRAGVVRWQRGRGYPWRRHGRHDDDDLHRHVHHHDADGHGHYEQHVGWALWADLRRGPRQRRAAAVWRGRGHGVRRAARLRVRREQPLRRELYVQLLHPRVGIAALPAVLRHQLRERVHALRGQLIRIKPCAP